MAADRKSRSSDDIWHLSIEDLFASDAGPARAADPGPFVINLRSSDAPIGPPPKGFPRFETLRLYQLTATTDGRRQYLLRLGVIGSELEADAILERVREFYPRASRDSAVAEDHAEIAKTAPAAPAAPPAPPSRQPSMQARSRPEPPPPRIASRPIRESPKPAEPLRIDIDDLLPELMEHVEPAPRSSVSREVDSNAITNQVEALVLKEPLETEVAPPANAVPTRTARRSTDVSSTTLPRPAPVLSCEIPLGDVLAVTDALVVRGAPAAEPARTEEKARTADAASVVVAAPPADAAIVADAAPAEDAARAAERLPGSSVRSAPAAPPSNPHRNDAVRSAPAAGSARAPSVTRTPSTTRTPSVAPAPVTARMPEIPLLLHPGAPSLDSTQTIRALTPIDLADTESSQWFAIQLSLADEPIDAGQVPNLDIFDEYRLYAVTGLHDDRVVHALRVGFFSSKVAAETVAGYLASFFDSPCIKRVSAAERERFAERCVKAAKDVGAAGTHTAIELKDPAQVRMQRADATRADAMNRRATDSPSLWSRLVAPRGR